MEGANCFCRGGPSCHPICKMLPCRRSPLWACSLCCSKYSFASLPPAPNSLLSKIERRGPTSFQFTFMSPFRWYRKWKCRTDVFNHWGPYGWPAARLGSVCGEVSFPQSYRSSMATLGWASALCPLGLLCTQVACSPLSPGSGTATVMPWLLSPSP